MFKRTKTKKQQTVEPTYDFSVLTEGQLVDEIRRAAEDLDALLKAAADKRLVVSWPLKAELYAVDGWYIFPGAKGFDITKVTITKTMAL